MWPIGAHPMGKPGCPELAFSTASMAKNLIVLTDLSRSVLSVVFSIVSTAEARTGRLVMMGVRQRKTAAVAVELVDLRPVNLGRERELGAM